MLVSFLCGMFCDWGTPDAGHAVVETWRFARVLCLVLCFVSHTFIIFGSVLL